MDKHRHSIRLKNYDYSQAGLYFVTICTENHSCLFGKINGGKMILNDAGKMVEKWYFELQNKFHDIRGDEYVIMPNHFHAIIVNVGADLCVRPNVGIANNIYNRNRANSNNVAPEHKNINAQMQINVNDNSSKNKTIHNPGLLQGEGGHIGPPLQRVIQWFKTMTTNEYIRNIKQHNWRRFTDKLWQRGYYEHVIRKNDELNIIREYINNNPICGYADMRIKNS